MARYRVTAPTFIQGALRLEDEIVDYDGQAGSTLAPVDRSVRRAVKDKAAGRRAKPAPAVLPPSPNPPPSGGGQGGGRSDETKSSLPPTQKAAFE